ncbi:unnamed protein product, partial [Rotaria magnacalcarata]
MTPHTGFIILSTIAPPAVLTADSIAPAAVLTADSIGFKTE